MRGAPERCVGSGPVTVVHLAGNVVGRGFDHSWRTRRNGGGGVDHRRQRLVVGRDCFGGIPRLHRRFRDHRDEGFARKAHHVDRQRMVLR